MMQDVIIIGCGVVGAACAYRLSRYRLRGRYNPYNVSQTAGSV